MSVSFEEHHAPNVKNYLIVFGALLVLTVVTVLVSYIHLPIHLAVLLALVIATFKAGLVASIFMHLKGEKKLIFWLLALTLFFTAVMMFIPNWDQSYLKDNLLHGEGPMGSVAHDAAAPEHHEP